jgi:hypothetical protein
MSFLPLAGVLTENPSDAVTAILGFTGLFGGAAHYGAILARQKKAEVDRATALGFFIGSGLGVLMLVKDYLR